MNPARTASASPLETDAVVIGAGPVGLFQVFELGLLEVRAHVIDALPEPGGQCVALYADKPIYDIPATPVSSGRELVARLLEQIKPFATPFHLGQQVDRVQRQEDGRFRVETAAGISLLAKVVVIAGGVGSFQPRRLKIEGLADFEGRQVFYALPQALDWTNRRIVVIGDGDLALDAVLRLAEPGSGQPASVMLMHRRDEFKAAPATAAELRRRRAADRIAFVAGQATGIRREGERLAALEITAADGETRTVPLDVLLVLTGLSPKLGPIADWGLALERKQLLVDTAHFETSVPGIYAVGDVNTYPGKRKLIVCGFHEATLAAFAAAGRVHPDRPLHLEYTTTSTRLHRLLGVAPAAEQ
jgi:thioredoxin reductase (NADPH)